MLITNAKQYSLSIFRTAALSASLSKKHDDAALKELNEIEAAQELYEEKQSERASKILIKMI